MARSMKPSDATIRNIKRGDPRKRLSDGEGLYLHLHTQYSLLDGAIRTKDLCKTVKERGMSSVAVTDHGNMFGALQFYQDAKAHGKSSAAFLT